MGVMRFRVFPPERITEEMVQQAYLSGIDRISWPVRASVEEGDLILQRSVSDSANLHVPWAVEWFGRLTLSSGSLMERCRTVCAAPGTCPGTIVEVRDQLFEWQSLGLSVPETVPAKISEAVQRLSSAVVAQEDMSASAGQAEAALRLALDASELLVAAYTEQVMVIRHRNEDKLASFFGVNLGTTLLDNYAARKVLLTFNAAQVPVCWRDVETTEGSFAWSTSDRQIEWCRAHGLKILAGPLLMLDPRAARLALPLRG